HGDAARPCPECEGRGEIHCCEGLQAQVEAAVSRDAPPLAASRSPIQSEAPRREREAASGEASRLTKRGCHMSEQATLGGGCFWCLEAVFEQLRGVTKVESGYAGGTVVNPTYHQVCTGTTNHAEVVQVTFDPAV